MTDFETRALELLQSIDESLKVLKLAADREKRKEDRKFEQMNDMAASFRPKPK